MPINFPIVDAHHHFWDPHTNYHPWLRDAPPIAFRCGDCSALKRRSRAPEYLADAAPLEVAATVSIETEWDPAGAAGKMHYAKVRKYGLFTGVSPLEHDRMALKLNGKDKGLKRADFLAGAAIAGLRASDTHAAIDDFLERMRVAVSKMTLPMLPHYGPAGEAALTRTLALCRERIAAFA